MGPGGGTDRIVRYADRHEETSLVQYHVRYRNRTQIAEAYKVGGFRNELQCHQRHYDCLGVSIQLAGRHFLNLALLLSCRGFWGGKGAEVMTE